MNMREFIGVAANAIAVALAIFGNFLLIAVAISVANDPHGLTAWSVISVLHPGIWYLLVALVVRMAGRIISARQ